MITVGLAISASPFGVVGVIVLLGSKRPLVNAWAFVIGWSTSVGLVAVLGYRIAIKSGGSSSSSSGAAAPVQIALGVALLVLALFAWRSRAKSAAAGPPLWMRKVESAGPVVAFGAGFVLPTWGLLAPAIDSAVGAGLSHSQAVATLITLMVCAVASLLVPVLLFTIRRDLADAVLTGWKTWLLANARGVGATLLVIIGATLTLRGLVGLT